MSIPRSSITTNGRMFTRDNFHNDFTLDGSGHPLDWCATLASRSEAPA